MCLCLPGDRVGGINQQEKKDIISLGYSDAKREIDLMTRFLQEGIGIVHGWTAQPAAQRLGLGLVIVPPCFVCQSISRPEKSRNAQSPRSKLTDDQESG